MSIRTHKIKYYIIYCCSWASSKLSSLLEDACNPLLGLFSPICSWVLSPIVKFVFKVFSLLSFLEFSSPEDASSRIYFVLH